MKDISHTRRYDWISFLELKSGYERESSVEVFGGKKDPSARLCFTPFFSIVMRRKFVLKRRASFPFEQSGKLGFNLKWISFCIVWRFAQSKVSDLGKSIARIFLRLICLSMGAKPSRLLPNHHWMRCLQSTTRAKGNTCNKIWWWNHIQETFDCEVGARAPLHLRDKVDWKCCKPERLEQVLTHIHQKNHHDMTWFMCLIFRALSSEEASDYSNCSRIKTTPAGNFSLLHIITFSPFHSGNMVNSKTSWRITGRLF